MIQRLRESEAYIPECTLVALSDKDEVIGHILLSKITIGAHTPSLALAPLSVAPNYQKQGIGKALVESALNKARHYGYQSVVVLGDPAYYQKFGFEMAEDYEIFGPNEVMNPYLMVRELNHHALKNKGGEVHYSEAFNL